MNMKRHSMLFILGAVAVAATARGDVAYLSDQVLVAWGRNDYGQCDVPAGSCFTQAAAGGRHSLALKSNGSLAAWGWNLDGQCNIPAGTDYAQVAGGYGHSLALKTDGSLAAWGRNVEGQCDVPAGTDYAQVAGGDRHTLALKTGGSLAAWGYNAYGQCNVPVGNFTQVAAGGYFGLALKSDGSLAAWGSNSEGQCNVPAGNFTQVAGGGYHTLALKADGSLAAWGYNNYGQCNVPAGTDYAQVGGGWFHTLALKTDGSVVAWGSNAYGQCDVPAGNDFVKVVAGYNHSLALKRRTNFDADLLVTGTGETALLQRNITVAGNATVETMMAMTGNPTMTVGGRTLIPGAGGITGAGTIAGDVRAEYGSWIVATGNLTLGDAASFTGFYGEGDIQGGSHTVTINSKAVAKLGALMSLDGGTLTAPNGSMVDTTGTLAGTGAVNGRFINQGLVAAGAPGEDMTFNSLVTGAGSFTGSMIFNGGFSPGNSAIAQHLDWATFTAANALTMEIGGLQAGQDYDQIIANYLLSLGGTLELELIGAFAPGLDDSFQLFQGPLSGTFSAMNLPSLNAGLDWDTSDLETTGTISVVPEPATVSLLALGGMAALRGKRK